MKFKIEKTWYVKDQQERCKTKKIYTDFYCSLCEWATLETVQKRMLIDQLLDKIHFKFFPEFLTGWEFNFYFDKEEIPERKENNLYFEEVIKAITHRDVKVNVKYDWFNGPTLNHVKIVFPNTNMPNIFVLFDFTDYKLYVSESSSGVDGDNLLVEYLMICVDAIYKTLSDKTTEWYDRKLCEFYNENYDRIFYNYSTKLKQLLNEDKDYIEDNLCRKRRYQKYFNCWKWDDVFKLASLRKEENKADVKWL